MSFNKDTISSGSAYYDNQFRTDPAFVQGYRKLQQVPKVDTIETTQARLEREIQKGLPEGRVFVVLQVGRYAILALVLPPYYLLFEGPKWVLIQLLPFMALSVEKMNGFLFFLSTATVDIWAAFRKRIARTLKKPKNLLTRADAWVNRWVTQTQKIVTARIEAFFRPILEVKERIKQKIQETMKWLQLQPIRFQDLVKKKTSQWKAIGKEKTLEVGKFFKRDLTINIQPVVAPIVNVLRFISRPVIHYTYKTSQVIQKAFHAITNPIQRFVQEKCIAPVKAIYNTIMSPIKTAAQQIKEVIVNQVQKVSAIIEQRIHYVAKGIEKVALAALAPIQRAIVHAMHPIFLRKEAALAKVKKLQFTLIKVFKRFYDEAKKEAKKLLIPTKKGIQVATQIGTVIFKWALKKRAIFSVWFAKLKVLFKKIVWGGRVVLAWTRVILRYSFNQLWN